MEICCAMMKPFNGNLKNGFILQQIIVKENQLYKSLYQCTYIRIENIYSYILEEGLYLIFFLFSPRVFLLS